MKVQYEDRGVRALLCTAHGALHHEIEPDEIDTFIADQNNLLWLDIDTAVTTDLSILEREFDFHELALEDAVRTRQRPKIDTYDRFSFIVFYAVDAGSPLEELKLCQVSIFVGPNYLVTMHEGHLTEIEESAARWQRNLQKIDRDIGTLLYSLLDAIVDDYFPVIDRMADRVEEIEEAVFERFEEGALEDIFRLKKSLLALRRVVAPARDVLNVIIRRDAPIFTNQSTIYFQDVYDHLLRVSDSIDVYRDLLSGAVDAYLSMSSNRLNQVMRSLTSWTIPLMAAALLAGIWGMNFSRMPELDWRLGYPAALAAIVLVFLSLAFYFHRRHLL